MSGDLPKKSVWPRRFLQKENLCNRKLVRAKIEEYEQIPSNNYEVIDKRVQVLDRHVKKVKNTVTLLDATLLKFFPGAFRDLLKHLNEAVDQFMAQAEIVQKTSKGVTKFYFGQWEHGPTSLMRHQFAKDLVAALKVVSDRVDDYFRNNFPEHWKFLKLVKLPGDISQVYQMFVLNDGISDSWQVDHSDFIDGYCAVIPFGNFKGGELLFPDINVKVAAKAGDLLFYKSNPLLHKNDVITDDGHQRSLVYYIQQAPVSRYLMSVNPELKTLKSARAYCQTYWCYKIEPAWRAPVKKNNTFKRVYEDKMDED